MVVIETTQYNFSEEHQVFQAINILFTYCNKHRNYNIDDDTIHCEKCMFLKNDFCGLIVDFAENYKGMDIDFKFLKKVIGEYKDGT